MVDVDSFMVESRKQSKTISNNMAEVRNNLANHIRRANDIQYRLRKCLNRHTLWKNTMTRM